MDGEDSFYSPAFTGGSVTRNVSETEQDNVNDISLPHLTSNVVANEEVTLSGLQLQPQVKSEPRAVSDVISSFSNDCCDKEEETMHCLHCSYSNVSLVEMKSHQFSLHPSKPACALMIHGSERYITFFCVKEICEYSTTVCKAYEKHLMGCLNLNINEKLSNALKERLHSSIDFVLDFHSRHGLEANPEFEDYVSSFIGLHVHVDLSGDSCSTLSHCIKETHLEPHVLNTTCASDPQDFKEIKLENYNTSYDQVPMLKNENKSDDHDVVDMKGPLHLGLTFTETIKRENIATNLLVDHLISGNPELENDVAGEFNMNSDFFSRKTENESMKSEINNSEMDTTDQNISPPPPRWIDLGLTNRLNESFGETKDLHSCHLCGLGFPSRTLLEKHSQKLHHRDWLPALKTANGPHESCLKEDAAKIRLSIGDNHVEMLPTYEMKQIIKESGEGLYKCKECGQTFGQKSHLSRHMRTHTGKKPFKCEDCGQTFSKKNTLNRHMRTHNSEKSFKSEECGQAYFSQKSNVSAHMRTQTGEKPFKCKECGQAFSEKRSVSRHMRTHTGEKPFKCEECGQTYIQKSTLIIHMRTHTGEKPFKCEECGQTYIHKSTLIIHMRTHTGEKPFKCKDCGQTFSQKSHLNIHMRTHTGEKPFKCVECGQTYIQKSSLNIHMRTHTGEKPFKCEECGQTYIQKSSLNIHMKTHTGEKPFKCEECGQAFSEKVNVSRHMRTHTGEKPYKCKECGQTFRHNQSLKVHIMRTHTGEKPFKCEECGQTYIEKSNLKRHMRSHTGEKPFKCEECGQTYIEKYYLKRHMRTHTGEKPFKCGECGQTFGQKSTLISHMRTHTGEKPFKCEECGQAFSRKGYVTMHMRTHTGEKPYKCEECGQAFSQKCTVSEHIMRKHTG